MKKRIALGTAVILAVLSFSVYAAVLAEGSGQTPFERYSHGAFQYQEY